MKTIVQETKTEIWHYLELRILGVVFRLEHL